MKAYKYRLYPTKSQEELLAKHFGCSRFVYNLGLEMKNEHYQKEEKHLGWVDVVNRITKLKKEEETKWLKEVNSQSLQMSIRNLDAAFVGFFKKRAKFPRFKSRKNKQSFQCPQHCNVDFKNGKFFLPKFREGIKAIFHREFKGETGTCTVSKTPTGKYFVSITVKDGKEEPKKETPEKEKCLGIDLGIKDYLVDSNGERVENPRHLQKKLRKLRKEQRTLSRRKKGGNNRDKQRVKVARVHEKVTNTRNDFLHKLTHELAEKQGYNCVAMETLNIQGMMKNHRLARHIGDAAWGTFERFLEYKLNDRGKTLLKIGQFEPSSKLCECGHKNTDLKLSQREWECSHCGTVNDRDYLAARNIKRFAFIDKNLHSKLGQDMSEFTLGEIDVGRSLSQEAPML